MSFISINNFLFNLNNNKSKCTKEKIFFKLKENDAKLEQQFNYAFINAVTFAMQHYIAKMSQMT